MNIRLDIGLEMDWVGQVAQMQLIEQDFCCTRPSSPSTPSPKLFCRQYDPKGYWDPLLWPPLCCWRWPIWLPFLWLRGYFPWKCLPWALLSSLAQSSSSVTSGLQAGAKVPRHPHLPLEEQAWMTLLVLDPGDRGWKDALGRTQVLSPGP